MKKKTPAVLISVLGLAGLLGGAGLAYSSLSEGYVPETALPEETEVSQAYQPETAPDFIMLNADGEEVRLADFAGKPILINFWASWCPPCCAELPYFQKAFQEYGEEVQFLMVNLTDGTRETVEKAETFIQENQYDFPLYFDTQGSGARAYSILSIPMTFFVDAQGGLTFQHIGALSEEELFAMLERQLGDIEKNTERGEFS